MVEIDATYYVLRVYEPGRHYARPSPYAFLIFRLRRISAACSWFFEAESTSQRV
jgi:hypothetical protein